MAPAPSCLIPGDYVEVGHPLAETSSNTRLQLKLDIPSNHQHNMKNIKYLRVRSLLGWQELPGEIISYEQYIEDGNAFISAYYSTSYSPLTPGSFIEIEAAFGSDQERLAIPTSALLEDFGIYTVMVQKTGESFESREIKTGIKNSEWTEVVHGLKENERIVSIGAYQVKMASMKGEAPEHGHTHSIQKSGNDWTVTTDEPDVYLASKLERVVKSTKRFIIIEGGRGSGKSVGVAPSEYRQTTPPVTKAQDPSQEEQHPAHNAQHTAGGGVVGV